MSPSVWQKIKAAFTGGDEPASAAGGAAAPASAPFLMKVEDAFEITGVGVVVTGQVGLGLVRTDDALIAVSADGKERKCRVVDIEMLRRKHDSGTKGDNVGIVLSGIARGQIAGGDTLRNA